MGLGFTLDLTDVGVVVSLIILFLVCFAVTVCGLCLSVMLVLFGHNVLSFLFGGVDGFVVLILMVLHLLQMRHDQRVVSLLLPLHFGVEVLYLRFELFDLFAGVLVEVVDHILLYLKCVTLHFRVLKLLTQVLDCDLELLAFHREKLVLRLGLFLLSFSLRASLRFFLSAHGSSSI